MSDAVDESAQMRTPPRVGRHAMRSDVPTATRAPGTPDSPPAKPFRARIRGLDGPRGIACMLVLAQHVGGHYSPNTFFSAGLQIFGQSLIFFFALSGFLLYLPILRRLFTNAASQPDVVSYARHRILRVFPAYLAIFVIASYLMRAVYLENAAVAGESGPFAGIGMMTDPGMIAANLTLVQSYIPSMLQTGINPSWSLTMEMVFYIVLPIFGVVVFWLRRRFGWNPVALALLGPIALFLLGTVGKVFAMWLADRLGISDLIMQNWGPNWVAVVLRSFLASSDNFAFGMLAAIVFVAAETGIIARARLKRVRPWTAVAVVPLIPAMYILIAAGSPFQSTVTSLISGLIILFIVIPFARGEDSAFARQLDWAPFEYCGRVSLSIYLWHFPVLIVLGRWGWMAGDSWPGFLMNLVIVATVSLILATLSFRFIEQPAINYAIRSRKR